MSRRLRMLSYNIQAGLTTSGYADYVFRSWKHVLPVPQRMANLNGIGQLMADYDIVGLQEVDTGSLRSGFVNQVDYLAQRAGFPHLHDQTNRRIGMISQHSNAVLSKLRPHCIVDHKLPGVIPGRGVLHAVYGDGTDALNVFVLHMALSRRAREGQIAYLSELVRQTRHCVVMGDLNFRSDGPEMARLLSLTGMTEPKPGLHTFPSWRPQRQIDHILVSPSLEVESVEVLEHTYSDHRPLGMVIKLPDCCLPESDAQP